MKTDEYNGLTIDEATRKANYGGFSVKVENSGVQQLDCAYMPNRITFKVANGLVIGATIG